MITKELVAGLREGDIVQFRIDNWPEGAALRGPLKKNEVGALTIPIPGDGGCFYVRDQLGHPFDPEHRDLIVISRAKPPVYVNHSRTSAVAGDVACDPENPGDGAFVWHRLGVKGMESWCDRWGYCVHRTDMSEKLQLLVDGETGQVVR